MNSKLMTVRNNMSNIEDNDNMIIDGNERDSYKTNNNKQTSNLSMSSNNINEGNFNNNKEEKIDISTAAQSLFNRNKNPKKRERSTLSTSKDNIMNNASKTNIIEFYDTRDPRLSLNNFLCVV